MWPSVFTICTHTVDLRAEIIHPKYSTTRVICKQGEVNVREHRRGNKEINVQSRDTLKTLCRARYL